MGGECRRCEEGEEESAYHLGDWGNVILGKHGHAGAHLRLTYNCHQLFTQREAFCPSRPSCPTLSFAHSPPRLGTLSRNQGGVPTRELEGGGRQGGRAHSGRKPSQSLSPAQEVSDPGQQQEVWQGPPGQGWRPSWLILEGLQVLLFRVRLGSRGGGFAR